MPRNTVYDPVRQPQTAPAPSNIQTERSNPFVNRLSMYKHRVTNKQVNRTLWGRDELPANIVAEGTE